ncbi:MAG: hypothetical protein MJY76_09065 [Bacteroidales bacterium]|nr:hypothetical protein [Bacteroidales bacterium]
MYAWLKYVAFALIGIFIGGFIFDVIKYARAKGGQWKDILLRILVWIIIFAIIVAVNIWLNRNWMPGKMLFIINPFGGV